MSLADEFVKYCSQMLEANYGPISAGIINKAKSKKNLDATSNIGDFEEFIDSIQLILSVISGKSNATNICNALRTKAIELNFSKEAVETSSALNVDALKLDINEFLLKIHATDICTPSAKTELTGEQKPTKFFIINKIEEFLMKNILPTEGDITRYAANLALEYSAEAEKIRWDIIKKVRMNIKNAIGRKAIRKEIDSFLIRYPQPIQTDVDDFINYIHLLKLNFQEDELRQQIEKERLYRKFHESQDMEISELDNLIDIIKTYSDKGDLIKAMQERELSYLIEDESGISDKLLFEFVNLIMLIEKDSLGGLYLRRMFRKTHLRQ